MSLIVRGPSPTPAARPIVPRILRAFVALALASCGGGGGTGPEPSPPVISVAGVTDGAVLDGPVTIVITVDVGTFAATLNGAPFFSGSTVAEPGSYALRIQASHLGLTSTRTVDFEIRFGTEGVLIVRMFDLGANDAGGGGDAILLTDSTSAGLRHLLVDAGPAGVDGSDPGFVARRLAALGVDTLEAVVLTHAHSDHFDGLPDVLRSVHVRRFFYNGQVRDFFRYENLVDLAGARAGERIVVGGIEEIVLGTSGATTAEILPPLATHLGDPGAGSTELNDGSLGTAVTRGTFSLFMAGDGEVEANLRWRTAFPDRTGSRTALKVGHHGANDAVFDNGSFGASAWLAHVDPELQLVTANGRSHPRIRALAVLLGRPSTRTYCTNVHGDVVVRVDGAGAWVVAVQRNAGSDCVAGTEATT